MHVMFAIWGLCMAALSWAIWNMPERKMIRVPADRVILQRTGDITQWAGLEWWNGRGDQAGLPVNNFRNHRGALVGILVWKR